MESISQTLTTSCYTTTASSFHDSSAVYAATWYATATATASAATSTVADSRDGRSGYGRRARTQAPGGLAARYCLFTRRTAGETRAYSTGAAASLQPSVTTIHFLNPSSTIHFSECRGSLGEAATTAGTTLSTPAVVARGFVGAAIASHRIRQRFSWTCAA